MIIGLTTTNDDERRIVEEAIANRHQHDEVLVYQVAQEMEEQLLGRDSVAHHARHQAQLALQHLRKAQLGLGLAAGIDMTPEGIFLICGVVARSRNGREAVGWSTPKIIPAVISQGITTGGNFDQLVEQYRQQWHQSDVFATTDIDELIHRHGSYTEAAMAALDALHLP